MFKTLLVISILTGGPATADLQSCQRLFAAAPQVLDVLSKGESHDYEQDSPGLGYSIDFVDSLSKLTLFFYDYQQETISMATALESFKSAARDMREVATVRGLELGEIKAFEVKQPRQLFRFQAETVTQSARSDFLALGVIDNCIVKVRLTAQMPHDEAKVWMGVILEYLNDGYS